MACSKVRLTQTHPGCKGRAGCRRYRGARSPGVRQRGGQPVGRTDHETIKGVPGVEPCAICTGLAGHGYRGGGRVGQPCGRARGSLGLYDKRNVNVTTVRLSKPHAQPFHGSGE